MWRKLTICVLSGVLAVVGSRAASAACPPERAPDGLGGFLNVLPAGQGSNATAETGPTPPHWLDQLAMYTGLLYDYATTLDASTLTRYFKRADFEAGTITKVEEPRAGACVVRDEFGVPHIYGDTAADVLFGVGWVTAQDRMFMVDALRHYGRGRLSEFLGPSDANLATDEAMHKVAGYREHELEQQIGRLARLSPEGAQAVELFDEFTAGMNAYIAVMRANPSKLPAEYPALQIPLRDWKRTDVVAIATLIQAIFAAGGGDELKNAELRRRLVAKLGPERGERLYRDLLVREEPEAPVTTRTSFPYLARGAVDPAAVALLDSTTAVVTPDPLNGLKLPRAMSNWLGVTAAGAEGKRPIAVMGPQTGYFAPQILMEVSIHGGGLNARGATFPGLGLVLLGRAATYAWSATSGGSDIVDIRVEKLCEPDGRAPTQSSRHYLYRGRCLAMDVWTDEWLAKPTAGGTGVPRLVSMTVERTVHGPVIGRGTVGGAPVAVVSQRSTWFGELDSTPAFVLLNQGKATTPAEFYRAANHVTGTFNWLWVSNRDLAFFHSGKYPVRAPGVDPELPSWGTGEWEWRGFLPLDAHPHAANPPEGYLVNWNNKPAREWQAADGNASFGTIHRVQSLDERLGARLAAKGRLSVVDLVQVMEDAATVDLRAAQLLPWALQLLDATGDVAVWTPLLAGWLASGAHRIDRDRSGMYDDAAAIALFDAWYDKMIHAVFDDELGDLYPWVPMPFDDGNRAAGLGSAFQSGYFGYLQKAFRQALGQPPADPLDELTCGDGTRAGCAALLASSLLDATRELTEQYGSNPTAWRADKSKDQIRSQEVGLVPGPDFDWQNRPTFQQVVQVEGPPVEEPDAGVPDARTNPGLGYTGGGGGCRVAAGAQAPATTALVALAFLALLLRRRARR